MNSETNDVLNYDENVKPKLPTGLNVLTILTFIGCAIFGLVTLALPMIYKFALEMMEKATSSGKELSTKQLVDMEKSKAAMELAQQNMIPLIIIGMIGIILCFIGALWIRKLKKDGYWMYVAGELAPVIAGFFLLGSQQYDGAFSIIISIGIPLIFVFLYTMQRKHLVY